MPIIIKKSKPETVVLGHETQQLTVKAGTSGFASHKPEHAAEVHVHGPITFEGYGNEEVLADLDTVRDAQKRIESRKPSQSAQNELKTIAELNAIDAQAVAEASKRLLAALVPEGHAPDTVIKITIAGRLVEIGKESMKRTVKDVKLACKLMGESVFWGVVSLPLKAVDDYLTKPQRDQVLDVSYDGKRKLTVKSNVETEL
jgi:hypothetical protein